MEIFSTCGRICDKEVFIIDSTRIGQSGEYLASAVLQRHFVAIAYPNIPTAYDLTVQAKSGEFLKCQVKTSNTIEKINGSEYWRFHASKHKGHYTTEEVDFFAFVILPKRLCFFELAKDVCGKLSHRIPKLSATPENEKESIKKTLGYWIIDE